MLSIYRPLKMSLKYIPEIMSVATLDKFQKFRPKPALKFMFILKYSNRAVKLRLFNRPVTLRYSNYSRTDANTVLVSEPILTVSTYIGIKIIGSSIPVIKFLYIKCSGSMSSVAG